jgi:hypothetical protein
VSHETELNLFNNKFQIDEGGNFRADGHFMATQSIKVGDGIEILDPSLEYDMFHIFISGMNDPSPLPVDFDNTLIFETTSLDNLNYMEIMFWDKTTGRPSLVLNQGAPNRATVIERSLMIGAQKGAKVLDGYYTAGDDFENLDFNTSMYGADLGVENNTEIHGNLFVDQIHESTEGAGVSINENFKVIDGEVYISNLAGQGNKPIQVDNDGRLYTLP